MSGFIKLHREILDHWVMSDPATCVVWFRLLLEASHKQRKVMLHGKLETIQRGQLIFGRDKFSEKSGISVAKVRTAIKNLKSDNMISQQVFSKYSIITITNYSSYQAINQQAASYSNQHDSQHDSQQTTTEQEGKETKEDNKKTKKRSLKIKDDWKPSLKTVAFIAEKHKVSTQIVWDEVSNFVDWWLGSGKTKADWEATFRNWCAKDYCSIHKSRQGDLLSERPEDFADEETAGKGW